ncbi:MAG: Gfo/Idh/MocA family protein [Reyranella sp.]|uniref:Gfo/Idh/MocA family protein n=2 Tax=Reyranella sp. TaxID=1929291 RepID=UPI003D104A73
MIRIGILGAGTMGKMHAAAYAGVADATVVGVYSRDAERAATVAAICKAHPSTDAPRLIDHPGIDAIDVCLPTPVHPEFVLAALRAGKHVFCETPLALQLGDAWEMQEAARRADRLLQVGLLMRSVAACEHVKSRSLSGKHGRLVSVTAWRLGSYLRADAPDRKTHYSDPSTELMTFDFDLIHWLMGRPATISATAVQTAHGPGEISALLHYEDGRHATVTASGLMPPGFPFAAGFRALFEHALYEQSTVFDTAGPPTSTFTIVEGGQPRRPVRVQDRNPYQVQLQGFVDCIAGRANHDLLDASRAYEALVLSTATQRSLAERRPVEID